MIYRQMSTIGPRTSCEKSDGVGILVAASFPSGLKHISSIAHLYSISESGCSVSFIEGSDGREFRFILKFVNGPFGHTACVH